MARVQLNNWLSDFESVAKAMREHGVIACTDTPVGGITLGPDPVKARRLEKAAADPKAERRRYYAEVLGRPVSDAEAEKLP